MHVTQQIVTLLTGKTYYFSKKKDDLPLVVVPVVAPSEDDFCRHLNPTVLSLKPFSLSVQEKKTKNNILFSKKEEICVVLSFAQFPDLSIFMTILKAIISFFKKINHHSTVPILTDNSSHSDNFLQCSRGPLLR